MFFYIFKCFVMFYNVAVSKLGIKLGFRLGKSPRGKIQFVWVNQCISPVE